MSNNPEYNLDITARKHKGSETSVAAFQGTAPEDRRKQRNKVLRFFKRNSRFGFTCEQISALLEIRYSAASARMSELQRDGLIEDSGERRPTSTGRPARVMRAR